MDQFIFSPRQYYGYLPGFETSRSGVSSEVRVGIVHNPITKEYHLDVFGKGNSSPIDEPNPNSTLSICYPLIQQDGKPDYHDIIIGSHSREISPEEAKALLPLRLKESIEQSLTLPQNHKKNLLKMLELLDKKANKR